MDTKVLLRLIKDDIKILENLNDSFINQSNLSPQEVEVALARAKALVMEFEMLNKNMFREENSSIAELDLKEKPVRKPEEKNEKNEKKGHSLRNFLPFIKTEEENQLSVPENPVETGSIPSKEVHQSPSPEPAASSELNEPFTLITDQDEDPDGILKTSPLPGQETIAAQEEEERINLAEEKTEPATAEEKNQFNNLLSPEEDENKFGIIPLNSIREGIGLNDRFLYIRELFQNKSDQFDQAITTLDEFSTIEDAVKFLKQHFKWNKSEAAEKFLLLIKRRYSK